jgi:AAA domain-containing protein
MRVTWLFGPPGVGKSTAAWRLYEDLTARGLGCGYVDIDQVGMCYPAQDDDLARHRLKGTVLAALLPNFAAAGAHALIVSGVLDPALAPWLRDELAGAELIFCRLVLGEDERRRRIAERGTGSESWDAVRRGDRELDDTAPLGPTVITDGLDPSEVAAAVRARVGTPAPASTALIAGQASGAAGPTRVSSAPGRVIWFCGSTGVGKSTVGWQVFRRLLAEGRTVGFLDLRQLGFVAGEAETYHPLASANVATAWDCFRAAGATHLVLAGAVETREQVQLYRGALAATAMTVYRLRASREELARRVHARGRGDGVRLAGDRLLGQRQEVLESAAALAWCDQTRLDAADVADAVVDTTGVTPPDLAGHVLATVR